MTFASAWALAGLLLLVPLVVLHLQHRHHPVREVPSLLVWREVDALPSPGDRGRRRLPSLPLLLLLQAAAIVFLVIALAQPRASGAARAPARVVVIDDSLRMSAPGRLTAAREAALRAIDAPPAGASAAIVVAGASPRTIYRGRGAGASAALAKIQPTAAPANLAAALVTASGLLGGRSDRIAVIRAPEDALPAHTAAHGELRDITIGAPVSDQGIFDASARCGIGSPSTCEIYAKVVNASGRPVRDRYIAQAAGRPPLTGEVNLAANSNAEVALLAGPGEKVTLRLPVGDAIAADDSAAVTVPGEGGAPGATTVTVVGTRSRSLSLAQALVSVPGVTLRLATPASYRAADASKSALVVLDGWLPHGRLPAAPALLLVDPPRLPGGRIGGTLSDTVVSGSDATSPLLEDVDLSSLAIDRDSARSLSLPSWITPVAWSPTGPLVAAGNDGRRRVAVFGFEPGQSNLPQLPSFPVLIGNLVAWGSHWAPPAATAGTPILVNATPGARTVTLSSAGRVIERAPLHNSPASLSVPNPGFYAVTERGPGVDRTATVAASAATPATPAPTAVDLRSARSGARAIAPTPLDDWFLAAALAAILLEALYWATRRQRVLA